MKDVNFHLKYYPFENPFPETIIRKWILSIIETENKACGFIDIIFCDDDYLLEINLQYLNHDTYTDIITFDYSDDKAISGDLFISIDRVIENGESLGIDFFNELKRVIAHGVLHLIGYNDKEAMDLKLMRAKENYYLDLA